MSLQKLMNAVSKWSDETFGEMQRNPAILHHLEKEVKELINAVNIDNDKSTYENRRAVREEFADCFLLILDSAKKRGINAETLIECSFEKLEICQKSKWGKPDKNRVVEHID